MINKCVGNCGQNIPPPDLILSMPPPPLPSFLLLKPITNTAIFQLNDSQPCFVTMMCDTNGHPGDIRNEVLESIQDGNIEDENTWIYLLTSSCIGVLMFGVLFALILLKCKETFLSSYGISYHDSNIKESAVSALGEPMKSSPFTSGGIFYPCATNTNHEIIRNQFSQDSRLLWATLTPHGTRHFISDMNNAQGGHYEFIDKHNKTQNESLRGEEKRSSFLVKSFDNDGFADYDYEDPTPLMDSYHDDLDSGYQEPHEIIGTLQHSQQSPTLMEHTNTTSLNYCSNRFINNASAQSNYATTITRKATLNRRISDAYSYNGTNI